MKTSRCSLFHNHYLNGSHTAHTTPQQMLVFIYLFIGVLQKLRVIVHF